MSYLDASQITKGMGGRLGAHMGQLEGLKQGLHPGESQPT